MTPASFVIKNALRNKRRALLCVLSMAVSLFLFATLLIALREITVPPEDIGAALRIIVRNKISLGTLLPARQRQVLERIPGVAAVTPFTWYGGKYKDEFGVPFAQFAIDAAVVHHFMSDARIAPEQMQAFVEDHRGCLVGRETARKYNLKLGDRMRFTGQVWPCDLEFTVRGFYEGTIDDRNMLFHHKYLDEASGAEGLVGTWWVKAESAEAMPQVTAAIDKAFANTSAEVRAETERAFQLSFVSMMGNVKLLVRSICSVVVFMLLLVTASTMSMSVRERFRELAVLKALGFRRHELFAFILAESFGLAMTGAVLGVAGAWVLSRNASALTQGVFLIFELTPRIAGLTFAIAALLGIVAGIAPSITVARASVVEGLKTLD